MKELEYPFDGEYILKKKKTIKKDLLNQNHQFVEKNIAILGGSTTNDIKLVLELFLLNYGIKPNFYESEYNKYWEDAMFENKELEEFKPDIIYICTSNKNIINFPNLNDSKEAVKEKLNSEYARFKVMWQTLSNKYQCPIIQNNFDYLTYRILGNKDVTDYRGKTNFITKLNLMIYDYAEENDNFYILDINYLSGQYGLDKWQDPFYWYMYKYAVAVPAIPLLAFNLANIIKAIYGKNKKGLVLDLDNTLWGGIVGDDGVDNLVIGEETSEGQVYTDFQKYLKEISQMGILLNINSKNDLDNALTGLNHVDGVLKPEDFIVIKANWEPKSNNMLAIASELNLGVDSLVFVDDNPAEREIVKSYVIDVAVPEMKEPYKYIQTLDHCGYFENIKLSSDDMKKNQMYKENVERNKMVATFNNYDDYLKSLDMKATIDKFSPIYMARIAQLTNKSNQFNLTTKRYNQSEIEETAKNDNYITLYGKLEDKFGDNGVVSVVIGKKTNERLDIDLWIMSCRVLKRDMEFAMMDSLIKECVKQNIKELYGYYYPTMKNGMVKDFYKIQGFTKINEDENGNTIWKFIIDDYKNKNKFIDVEENK